MRRHKLENKFPNPEMYECLIQIFVINVPFHRSSDCMLGLNHTQLRTLIIGQKEKKDQKTWCTAGRFYSSASKLSVSTFIICIYEQRTTKYKHTHTHIHQLHQLYGARMKS